MIKTTIEIGRIADTLENHNDRSFSLSGERDSRVLGALVKWSQQVGNTSAKVYCHVLRLEKVSDDFVYYLDIYHQ